jgi:hypothetical protein
MRWLAALVAAAASLGVVWWRWHTGARRQRRLMLLCRRAGLDFAPVDPFPDTAWLPFPMFGRPKHGTENVVWDRRLGTEVRAFDYWYEEPTDDQGIAARRRLTCAVVPLAGSARRLRVGPRDVADDMWTALGMREVRLELERFNRRFIVETEDERFAFAFLDQRMMEALLTLPESVTAEAKEHVLLLTAPLLPAEEVLLLFDAAVRIHRKVPRVVASLFPPRPAEGPFEDRWLQGRWSPDPTHRSG